MAYRIGDACNRCGECEWVCPKEAISMGERIFVVDPNRCTECAGIFASPECAAICPMECCIPDLKNKKT